MNSVNASEALAQSAPKTEWSVQVMRAATFYFLLCGVTALFLPSAWDFAAGLPVPSSPLLLAIIGTLMMGQAAGSLLVTWDPFRHVGILVVLIVSTLLDLLVVVGAIRSEELPMLNGSGFVLLDLVWASLFVAVYLKYRKGGVIKEQV